MDTEIRILLVDDDIADLERTLEALRRRCLGNAVRTARGGQEALDYLFGRGRYQARRRFPLPEVILLDLHMPGTDGFEVLRQVRQAESLRRIPVVALCTTESEGERSLRCAHGANRYVVKPVTFESFSDLGQQIENWTLRLDRPGRYAASSPECTTNPPCSRMEWNSIFGQISRAALSSS